MRLGAMEVEAAAKAAAGNWRHFECFAWHRDLDDADQWCIVDANNRDRGLLHQSNAAAIEAAMEPFLGGDVMAEQQIRKELPQSDLLNIPLATQHPIFVGDCARMPPNASDDRVDRHPSCLSKRPRIWRRAQIGPMHLGHTAVLPFWCHTAILPSMAGNAKLLTPANFGKIAPKLPYARYQSVANPPGVFLIPR